MEAVAQALDRNKKDLSNMTAATNTVSKSQIDERHSKLPNPKEPHDNPEHAVFGPTAVRGYQYTDSRLQSG
jgi:hypothetical protein